ncbi:MAG: cytochrome c oxidase subunit II [Alphaproteobacteria bacterium]|nr:cytochrome c oxidase subunit II [Alphaproteobacteria bacterium]
MKKINFWVLSLSAFIMNNSFALAQQDVAKPMQLGLREPATPQMERIAAFHDDLLMWIITVIVIFVTALLIWVAIKYNAKANPTPSKTTHNVLLEVIWTVVPVVILIVVAVPSFKLLYYLDRTEEPEMTLKVTGYQWYWGYEYQDTEGVSFLSYMIPEDEVDESKGQRRLLSTDNPVVLPIDTNIQILITAADVLHAFTVPAFGIKKDAVPGRMNETWVRIDKPGTYFGQCSEICGKDHSYMPIEIKAVTKDEFEKWLVEAKDKFAENAIPENGQQSNTLQLASYAGAQ